MSHGLLSGKWAALLGAMLAHGRCGFWHIWGRVPNIRDPCAPGSGDGERFSTENGNKMHEDNTKLWRTLIKLLLMAVTGYMTWSAH